MARIYEKKMKTVETKDFPLLATGVKSNKRGKSFTGFCESPALTGTFSNFSFANFSPYKEASYPSSCRATA